MAIFRNLSTLLILSGAFLLTGCEQFSSKTVAQMCEEQPDICNDLNPDSWCRAEKAEIIKHRFEYDDAVDEMFTYELLMHFEDYQACIGDASQIKHIMLREKESGRMRGFLTAQREIKRLAEQTRYSKVPYLAYYQWSRHGHEDALRAFLRAADNGELNSASLNVAHATYLVKFDSAKAINALYKALSLYTEDEEIDIEIFKSLFTLHNERDNFPEAVVWGLVGTEFEDNKINREKLIDMAEASGLQVDELSNRANTLYSRIKARQFTFNG